MPTDLPMPGTRPALRGLPATSNSRCHCGGTARTGADAAPDLAAASALLADHQLGAEAERALTLAVEAVRP